MVSVENMYVSPYLVHMHQICKCNSRGACRRCAYACCLPSGNVRITRFDLVRIWIALFDRRVRFLRSPLLYWVICYRKRRLLNPHRAAVLGDILKNGTKSKVTINEELIQLAVQAVRHREVSGAAVVVELLPPFCTNSPPSLNASTLDP